jgi:group I intron endonuclease
MEIWYHIPMACVYTLYSISNPQEHRYIGISQYDTAEKRFTKHKYNANEGARLPIYDWMRKHDDICVQELETGLSFDEAKEREVFYIAKFKEEGHRLLNLTFGGDGVLGYVHSEETRKKKSESMKKTLGGRPALNRGTTHSEETKKKMSEAHKGKVSPNKGKKLSEEWRKNMSDSHKKRWKNIKENS